ncbi:MAG: hypothetical protein AMXMBFR58_29110 [Phycisphaerae bacterium]
MKTPLVLAALVTCVPTVCADIYSNFGGAANPSSIGLATGSVSRNGTPAPPGYLWSEAQDPAAAIIGTICSANLGSAFRVADDVRVPAGQSWHVSRISVFAFRTGSLPGDSPVLSGYLRIWDGPPDDGVAQIIATGTLGAVSDTDVYRISDLAGGPGTHRLVRRVNFDFAHTRLSSGTYWIEYQLVAVGTETGLVLWSPPITVAGVPDSSVTGAVSQVQVTNGSEILPWRNIQDPNTSLTYDLPFIIDGTIVPAPPLVSNGASFRGLGDLPGGSFQSDALAVSRNGRAVAGWGRSESRRPFRWTHSGGMVDLSSSLPLGFGEADAMSDDGGVVVGKWTVADGGPDDGRTFPIRWAAGTGALVLSGIPTWVTSAWAYGCSQNGGVVVGGAAAEGDLATHPFVWTQSTGLFELAVPPEFWVNGATCKDVSADGSVVVGQMFTDAYLYHGFRWTAATGVVDLGFGAGITSDVKVEGISDDGRVIVGSGRLASGDQVAFRWTSTGGFELLGDLPGGQVFSRAYDASQDGSVIVGQSRDAGGDRAFVWTRGTGMVALSDHLTAARVMPAGWSLTGAWDVSSDGRWIVGRGINPLGHQEAFLASTRHTPVPTSP